MMDASLESKYQYKPLNQQEIRLIRIEPCANNANVIQCSLLHVELARTSSYAALSYCWGSAAQSHSILLDGIQIPITENLYHALYRLRASGRLLLWVDAVCIDQRNDRERNFQVTRMSAIYKNAREVLVWLGPAADNSDDAMKALQSSHALNAVSNESSTGSGSRKIKAAADLNGVPGQAIAALFQREYWHRLWIIQEIARGIEVRLFCGDLDAGWDGLQLILDTWVEKLGEAISDQDAAAVKNLCMTREHVDTRPVGLLEALANSRHSRSTNHRDKVYGILGLTWDGGTFVPEPNYGGTESTICHDMSLNAILGKKTLDYIFLASWQSTRYPSLCSGMSKLPSWCVDYLHLDHRPLDKQLVKYLNKEDVRHRLGVRGSHWNSTAGSSADAHNVLLRGDSLHVSAYHIAIVNGLGAPFDDTQATIYHSNRCQPRSSTDSVPRDIVRILSLYFTRYKALNDQNYGDSFWERIPTKEATVSTDVRLQQWFSSNDAFLIFDRRFGEWISLKSSRMHDPFYVTCVLCLCGVSAFLLLIPKLFSYTFFKMIEMPKSKREAKDALLERLNNGSRPDYITSMTALLEEGLRLMTTVEGSLGWAHPAARPGDHIALISGCSMPAVLRGTSTPEHFILIGHAYLDGFMDGEMWRKHSARNLKDAYIV
jgi:hypothetical protein